MCVANGVFVSSKNRSLNKQRPHSPSANCVQLRDAVALNSVLAVAQIALGSKGAIVSESLGSYENSMGGKLTTYSGSHDVVIW